MISVLSSYLLKILLGTKTVRLVVRKQDLDSLLVADVFTADVRLDAVDGSVRRIIGNRPTFSPRRLYSHHLY